jgi:hypothetical protein
MWDSDTIGGEGAAVIPSISATVDGGTHIYSVLMELEAGVDGTVRT